ncbi:peptidoglycan editing factor PgeF [Bacillus gobiensis]|uniref:peptidoglycan editing factor PgeF n=1 Tax=Bacillus gobiensis TaxID=1441095 RepID=UPI003D24A514
MNSQISFIQKNEATLLFDKWDHNKVLCGMTTKNGGVSDSPFQTLNTGLHVLDINENVIKNRELVAQSLGFPLQSWVFADQTHESSIQCVTKKDAGKGSNIYDTAIKSTDGLYTNEKNVVLALCFADCVPLYFYDPAKSLAGIAHAGWKGTVLQIGKKMAKTWQTVEGSRLEDIQAVIGPSIGSCCYKVDERVIEKVKQLSIDTDSAITEVNSTEYMLNLKELNRLILLDAGIKEQNIAVSPLCTSCEDELFFSHRRDKGKTGRMMSFIGFKEA